MNMVGTPDAGGSGIDPEVAAAARAKLRSSFGAHLAAKASDAFCLAVAQPSSLEVRTRTFGAGPEAMPGPQTTSAVIEFVDRPADFERSTAIRRRATTAILRDLQGGEEGHAAAARHAGPA